MVYIKIIGILNEVFSKIVLWLGIWSQCEILQLRRYLAIRNVSVKIPQKQFIIIIIIIIIIIRVSDQSQYVAEEI